MDRYIKTFAFYRYFYQIGIYAASRNYDLKDLGMEDASAGRHIIDNMIIAHMNSRMREP